jgi:V/A-type H+-transporting ATPase subunit D
MAIKYQYNKISLQQMYKQLEIRERILPSLKNKESALRMEVQQTRDKSQILDQELQKAINRYEESLRLWVEFDPAMVEIREVDLYVKKIAGVKTPELKEIHFSIKVFSVFARPKWFLDGIEVLKNLATLAIEREIVLRKMELLDYARRKTTQKVNLYEKIQIPGYQDAIRKIRRFLEDEENLSKASQKIIKSRHQREEMQKAS